MGAKWEDKPVGSFGDLGTFSSYYSHHICTLEGGLTVSKDKNFRFNEINKISRLD